MVDVSLEKYAATEQLVNLFNSTRTDRMSQINKDLKQNQDLWLGFV